jgi:hypothetical protein
MDRADAIIVRHDPVTGPPERTRFEPRADGRWTMVDEWHNGCRWVGRGAEIVESVTVER